MGYKEKDIMHEQGKHWVLKVQYGYEVYRIEGTHSVRCGIIGYKGEFGLQRAIKEVERREIV